MEIQKNSFIQPQTGKQEDTQTCTTHTHTVDWWTGIKLNIKGFGVGDRKMGLEDFSSDTSSILMYVVTLELITPGS